MAPKFPTRTVVLMSLTIVAFIWFWWQTHQQRPAAVPTARVRLMGGAQSQPAPDRLTDAGSAL